MTKLYLRVQTDLSPSCWSSSFSTCWCWCRLLPSALQHLQLGFVLVVWDPLQECCHRQLLSACGPGSGGGAWNMLGAVYFFPMIFTNRRWFVSWYLYLLSLCLFILFSPSGRIHFQIVMNSSEDGEQHPWFSLSLTIVCSVLFSGDSDFFPFLSALSALFVVTLGHFSPEPPGRWCIWPLLDVPNVGEVCDSFPLSQVSAGWRALSFLGVCPVGGRGTQARAHGQNLQCVKALTVKDWHKSCRCCRLCEEYWQNREPLELLFQT